MVGIQSSIRTFALNFSFYGLGISECHEINGHILVRVGGIKILPESGKNFVIHGTKQKSQVPLLTSVPWMHILESL